jgi:hypothetical protein
MPGGQVRPRTDWEVKKLHFQLAKAEQACRECLTMQENLHQEQATIFQRVDQMMHPDLWELVASEPGFELADMEDVKTKIFAARAL